VSCAQKKKHSADSVRLSSSDLVVYASPLSLQRSRSASNEGLLFPFIYGMLCNFIFMPCILIDIYDVPSERAPPEQQAALVRLRTLRKSEPRDSGLHSVSASPVECKAYQNLFITT
jgi:hypothetical protein